MNLKTPIWVWIAIVLTGVFSLVSLSYRYKVEQRNKAVGLIVDMQAIHDSAASMNVSVPEFLKLAKEAGLTGVSISEEHWSDLVSQGRIQLDPGHPNVIRTPDPDRVRFALNARFRTKFTVKYGTPGVIELLDNLDPETLRQTSIGINPSDARKAREAGLLIIARHSSVAGATPEYINAMLGNSRTEGATIYLAEGDSTIGPGKLKTATAEALKALGMGYATPEFAKIAGDPALAAMMPENLYRLHSAQAAEVVRMQPSEFLDRFGLAYCERNMRLLLLRPLESVYEQPLLDTIKNTRREIVKDGGTVRMPKPFEEPGVPSVLFALIGLGGAVVVYWMATQFLAAVGMTGWVASALTIISVLVAALSGLPQARPYSAIVLGMAFPIAAYLMLEGRDKINILREYALMTLTSLVGGLCIAGLLNGLPYLIHTDQFSGVKVTQFLPILLIAVLVISRRMKFRDLAKSPVYWGAAILSIVGLVALAVMMARSGNDSPAAVSGLELKFRAILDTILYTRPRTKEFMLGHPALILGLALLAFAQLKTNKTSLANWGAVLVIVGAIGQTSVVNTLCHLHTPIDISLARIGIGWILGGIIGLFLWLILKPRLRLADETER